MNTKRHMRWRLLADVELQGILCVRVAFYWIACQIAVIGTICGFSCLTYGGGDSSANISQLIVPALIVSFLTLPLVLFDVITFSNRFAGPLLNFRKKFAELAEHNESESMHFRKGDFYPDLSENFNKLRDKIQPEDV